MHFKVVSLGLNTGSLAIPPTFKAFHELPSLKLSQMHPVTLSESW